MTQVPADIADRRKGDRVRLRELVPARFGTIDCEILELGRFGARIRHSLPYESPRETLRFLCFGERIAINCRAAHTRIEPATHVTGLEFVSSDLSAARAVRQIIGQHVATVLAEQRANALGTQRQWPEIVPLLRELGMREPAQQPARYLRFEHHADGSWTRTPTSRSGQPAHGFTVLDTTPDAELTVLKQTWEIASVEHRPLIRAVMALSLDPDTSTPNDLYIP